MTTKNDKKELCSICLLNETCQNNFDYQCVEASDFLYGVNIKTYTVKDDFLDSLIDKSNIGLRDNFEDNFSQAEADRNEMNEELSNSMEEESRIMDLLDGD